MASKSFPCYQREDRNKTFNELLNQLPAERVRLSWALFSQKSNLNKLFQIETYIEIPCKFLACFPNWLKGTGINYYALTITLHFKQPNNEPTM